MTAEEIRTCMDAVADAKNRGECEDGEQERMAAMMIAEIAAQLAELNANLHRIFQMEYSIPKLTTKSISLSNACSWKRK